MTSHKIYDWSFFNNRTFCINLITRDDRIQEATKQFKRVNLENVAKFYRVKKHPISGRLGCWKSHRNVMAYGIKHNLKIALIFEDDVQFAVRRLSQNIIDTLTKWIQNSKLWDIIYLGHLPLCIFNKSKIYDKNIPMIVECQSHQTHGYIVNLDSSKIQDFVRNVPIGGHKEEHLDWYFRHHFKTFCLIPMVAFQQCDENSDIAWFKFKFLDKIGHNLFQPKFLAHYEKKLISEPFFLKSPILCYLLFVKIIIQALLYKYL